MADDSHDAGGLRLVDTLELDNGGTGAAGAGAGAGAAAGAEAASLPLMRGALFDRADRTGNNRR